jgi:hypothetical protein
LALRCFVWGKRKDAKSFEQKDSKVSKKLTLEIGALPIAIHFR